MRDARVAELAGRQFNRISRGQLAELGLSEEAIQHRLATGRLVSMEQGVFAIAPALEHDDWGRWMGATLTAPGSVLSNISATAAWELLSPERRFETVTRPGSGGPRRHGGIRVYRSLTLEGERTELRGIPITTVPRTLLDLSRHVSDRALARALREAVRLHLKSLAPGGAPRGPDQGGSAAPRQRGGALPGPAARARAERRGDSRHRDPRRGWTSAPASERPDRGRGSRPELAGAAPHPRD